MFSLTIFPIGYIRTPYADRYRAPRQPGAVAGDGEIVLEPGRNFEQAVEDLAGFERIWVIYWFNRNTTWKPKVLTPRDPRVKRGLFATRSPHRPNPLGLSLLRLISVEGRIIRVGEVDLLDGTPIFDIKPYLPGVEAFPDAAAGWLDHIADTANAFQVIWSPLAEEQTEWLAGNFGIDIADIAQQVLARDPAPHPYRRITAIDNGQFELAIKSWRIRFTVHGATVTIERMASGYPAEQAALPGAELHLHDGAAHAAFHARWA